jgi:hypothetical protein
VSGGSNQVNNIRGATIGAWKMFAGHVQATANDGTGIPSSTCNVKYVYDGSDYIKFKKNQAINRTYNDYAF